MFADHVRTACVVVLNPLRNDVIQMLVPKQDEFLQALPLDALNDSFTATTGTYTLCERNSNRPNHRKMLFHRWKA
jgi:hypothetical protein